MGYSAHRMAPSTGQRDFGRTLRPGNRHSQRVPFLRRQRATVARANGAEGERSTRACALEALRKKPKFKGKRQNWPYNRPLYSQGFASSWLMTMSGDSVTNQQAIESSSVINSFYTRGNCQVILGKSISRASVFSSVHWDDDALNWV